MNITKIGGDAVVRTVLSYLCFSDELLLENSTSYSVFIFTDEKNSIHSKCQPLRVCSKVYIHAGHKHK